MWRPFDVYEVFIIYAFQLLFITQHDAFAQKTYISFVPQTINKNESSLHQSPDSANLEKTLRFWAVVISFKDQILVIESIENAGTEPAAKREELKVRTYGGHALAIVQTNVNEIPCRGKASVAVLGVTFENCEHVALNIKSMDKEEIDVPKVKELKRKRKQVDQFKASKLKRVVKDDREKVMENVLEMKRMNPQMEDNVLKSDTVQRAPHLGGSSFRNDEIVVSPEQWNDDELKFLCRLPFLAHVVSVNWLFGKKEAIGGTSFPKHKFTREIQEKGKQLKCWKDCIELLHNAEELQGRVKEKVTEIRTNIERSLRKAITDHRSYFQHKPKKLKIMAEEKSELVFNASLQHDAVVNNSESLHRGDLMKKPKRIYEKCSELQMDGNKAREFSLMLPSDILLWDYISEDHRRKNYAFLRFVHKQSVKQLWAGFIRTLQDVDTSDAYGDCDMLIQEYEKKRSAHV